MFYFVYSTTHISPPACGRPTMGNEKSLPDRCNSSQTSYLSHNYNHHQLNKTRSHPVVTFRHSTAPSTFSNSTCTTDDHLSSAYNSYSSRPPSRTPSTTKSYSSSSAYSSGSVNTLSTTVSNRTIQPSTNTAISKRSSSEAKQTKYLKEQLYIKSYLDIVEQDRLAQSVFQTAKPGIRNYTPKILVQTPPKKELDVWI